MKCLLILLTVGCVCHIISSQNDEDPYSGLGFLKTRLETRIYECGKSWLEGCLTRNATRPTGHCQCVPNLEISSEKEENAQLGGSITLHCLFFGFPLPAITWNGPQNRLPAGRYQLWTLTMAITLYGITASDEGNYTCSASNVYGEMTHTLRVRVVAAPVFKNKTDGPCNTSVTEGESATFNCIPFAIPEANITWLQNGRPIDTDNPPERFVFSSDNRSLTVRNVCRDCVDSERRSDLTVIQCNATNVHGYAFAQGYLKVLTRTYATIRGSRNVPVDFLEEKEFVFQCKATSDPSRPSTVRWYKTEPYNDLVRDEPPNVYVTKDILVIMFPPNCSAYCSKYLGEYRCEVDIGISRGSDTITLSHRKPKPAQDAKKEDSFAMWKIFLTVGAVGLVLLLIGFFLVFYSRRHLAVRTGMQGRKLPNPHSVRKRIGHKSVNLPLSREGSSDRSMRNVCSMYEQPGYDSIDQVLEDMSRKKSHSAEVHGYNKYETTCAPQKEDVGTGRPMLNEEATVCDDAGNLIPLKEVKDGGEIDQKQIVGHKDGESGKCPKTNDHSESMNDNLNLNRGGTDGNFDLRKSGLKQRETMNPYLDLFPKEASQYMDMDSKTENQNKDMGPKNWSQYLSPKELNQYMNMGPKEEGQNPKEVKP